VSRVERIEKGAGKVVSSIRGRWLDGLLLILLIGFAAFVFSRHGPFEQGMRPDASIQIYVAQEIARGNPPYVKVFFPKTPLTGLLGAMAIFIGRPFRVSDVIAIRALFFVVAVICVPFIYLLARRLAESSIAGVMVALVLVFIPHFGWFASSGPEPKILTMFWGLISLWALARSSWFLGGLAGSLSFLSWQPGGIFILLALGMATLSSTTERKRGLLWALLGVLIPLCLVTLYLFAVGALAPALRQMVLDQFVWGFSASERGSKGLVERIGLPLVFMRESLTRVPWFAWLGPLGWAMFTLEGLLSVARRAKGSSSVVAKIPVLLSGYFWLAFAFFDFQGYPDLIPLFFYLAFGLGWLLWQAARLLARVVSGLPPVASRAYLQPSMGIIFVLLLTLYSRGGPPEDASPNGLEHQAQEAARLDKELGAEGQIQAFGNLVPIVLAGRLNLTPVIHLGPKHYSLAMHEPGGFEGIIDTLWRERPEIIIVNRNFYRPWVRPLRRFLKENYECSEEWVMICRLRE